MLEREVLPLSVGRKGEVRCLSGRGGEMEGSGTGTSWDQRTPFGRRGFAYPKIPKLLYTCCRSWKMWSKVGNPCVISIDRRILYISAMFHSLVQIPEPKNNSQKHAMDPGKNVLQG